MVIAIIYMVSYKIDWISTGIRIRMHCKMVFNFALRHDLAL